MLFGRFLKLRCFSSKHFLKYFFSPFHLINFQKHLLFYRVYKKYFYIRILSNYFLIHDTKILMINFTFIKFGINPLPVKYGFLDNIFMTKWNHLLNHEKCLTSESWINKVQPILNFKCNIIINILHVVNKKKRYPNE